MNYCQHKYLRIAGTNRKIGYALGQLARTQHNIIRPKVENELRLKCQQEYMMQHYPIHYERMQGFAEAYGEELQNSQYDFTCFGKALGTPVCSAVFYPKEFTSTNSSILSRNLDLPTESSILSNPYIIELHPDKGYNTLGVLSFDLFGVMLDGINSEGLVVTHLAADTLHQNKYTPAREYGVGINEMLVVQLLLDNCKNTKEAKEWLLKNKHFYMSVSTHLLVADEEGNSFVWEYGSDHNSEYITNGDKEINILTNFLLHKFPSNKYFPKSIDKACPFSRYLTLKGELKQENIPYSLDVIKKINEKVFINDDMFKCENTNKTRTIYHTLYDLQTRSLSISFYQGDWQKRSEYLTWNL